MNLINVDADEIKSMCEEGRLRINMKPQRTGQGKNYLFTPGICVILRNVHVNEVNDKYIIFNLKRLDGEDCKRLGDHLQNYLRRSYYIEDTLPFYNIVNENENGEFWVRCYLSQLKGKPALSLQKSDQIETITLEIKNIWHLSDKLGFNIEVRCVKK